MQEKFEDRLKKQQEHFAEVTKNNPSAENILYGVPSQQQLLDTFNYISVEANKPPAKLGLHNSRRALTTEFWYQEAKLEKSETLQSLFGLAYEKGATPFAVTTALAYYLIGYLALKYSSLTELERASLFSAYREISGDLPDLEQALSSKENRMRRSCSLKNEINEITFIREKNTSVVINGIVRSLNAYTQDLLEGNTNGRRVIDKYTNAVFDPQDPKYYLGAFFPKDSLRKNMDSIVLHGGGCSQHFAITVLWTVALDEDGNILPASTPVSAIASYKVFRTMCNAGLGAAININDSRLYQVRTGKPIDQPEVYTVCTQEILLPEGVPYSYAAMRAEVEKVIQAEHEMFVFYQMPAKYCTKGGCENEEFNKQWDTFNQCVRLGPVIEDKSSKNQAQLGGVCTLQSSIEYMRWILLRYLEPNYVTRLLDGFWMYGWLSLHNLKKDIHIVAESLKQQALEASAHTEQTATPVLQNGSSIPMPEPLKESTHSSAETMTSESEPTLPTNEQPQVSSEETEPTEPSLPSDEDLDSSNEGAETPEPDSSINEQPHVSSEETEPTEPSLPSDEELDSSNEGRKTPEPTSPTNEQSHVSSEETEPTEPSLPSDEELDSSSEGMETLEPSSPTNEQPHVSSEVTKTPEPYSATDGQSLQQLDEDSMPPLEHVTIEDLIIILMQTAINNISKRTGTLTKTAKDKITQLENLKQSYCSGNSQALCEFIVFMATARDSATIDFGCFSFSFFKREFGFTASANAFVAEINKLKCYPQLLQALSQTADDSGVNDEISQEQFARLAVSLQSGMKDIVHTI